ncbi:MAG TPA: GNAT family N-acetyltransferase [Dongiaceae bacterium]|nr:GNAT family N-acetyltransferase [Dongiaceae bacterium]
MFRSTAETFHVPRPESVPKDPGRGTPLTISVYGHKDWKSISAVWSRLEFLSPYASFYLSEDWISAWLEVFGTSLRPRILVFEEERQPVAACVLTRTTEPRGPFRVSRMVLNTGAEPQPERTLTEFNNILCCRGKEEAVARALGAYVNGERWDEFTIDGIDPGPLLTALQIKAFPKLPASIALRPTYSVNLEQLRRNKTRYLETLSANTRAQIRRSLRELGGPDRVDVQIARDLPQAEHLFAEMCALHQKRWQARGETGAFANNNRVEFHRALIRRAYAKGSIHLVRVASAEQTVGILYNFVRNGKVYFFQSGFQYTQGQRLKPGLVTHASAIQKYLELGFSEYDFLVGDARYKRSLAQESKALAWVVFARPSLKLSVIQFLRTLKRRIRRQ